MIINEYISSLKASKRMEHQVVFHRILPESPPKLGDPAQKWPKLIEKGLSEMGIQQLYQHQAKALDFIRNGRHTVVATPTASGKTLIYNLPVMEKILANPTSRALYLFPLKALAQDQLQGFNALSQNMGQGKARAAIYDGDTSSWFRKKIRENLPHVIMSNPEMLHLSFLPYHTKWSEFFSQLSFVVLDEVHTYRGVMGSHMAQVIRRLRRICSYYGSNPIFIFCSATISNPAQLSEQLTGLQIEEITESGAPKGNRHIVFMDPIEGAAQTAIQLLKAALHRELRTIVYTQSRKLTELIAMWSQNRSGYFATRISAYRAGFLPEERREIEAKLAGGELLAVISTSALELGIDIGDLDLCILVGYPGTVVSTFQRGGRVGRSGQDSALILIAGEDALDQYFMRHPDELISREPESAVINPHNKNIVSRHLVCAAAELPLEQNESYISLDHMADILSDLEEKGQLLRSAEGSQWYASRKMPHREVDLRGSGDQYTIVEADWGSVIGEIDAFRAFKETHPGAIYLHMGQTWLVKTLDTGTRTAVAKPAKVNYYTRVNAHKDTEILEVYEEQRIRGTIVKTGRLKVTEQVVGYEKWSIHGKKRLNRIALDLPPLVFETDGLWFVIPREIQAATERRYLHFMGGIHAVEHAAIGIFPLLVLTDRNDLGGISTPFHPEVNGPAVFIYDGNAGGAGLSRQAFRRALSLLKHTFNAIKDCPCETGCPSCVHSPKCGSGNRPIDKAAAHFILHAMLEGKTDELGNDNTTTNPPSQNKHTERFNYAKDKNEAPEKTNLHNISKNNLELPVRIKSTRAFRLKRKRKIEKETAVVRRQKRNDNATNHFCVLDIETQLSAEEVGGWNRADLMKVSCAVIYDSMKEEYIEFTEDVVPNLIHRLAQYNRVVGFNIKKFDYRVLSGYTNFDFTTIPTLDILEDVYRRLGYRLSLDHLASVTLGAQKTADGLQALKWWKQGKIQEIIEYCRADVRITKELYLYGKEKGYLLFTNKAKQTVRIPVHW